MQNARTMRRSFGLRQLFAAAAATALAACTAVRPAADKASNNFENVRNTNTAAIETASINAQAGVVQAACKAAGETHDKAQENLCAKSLLYFYLGNRDQPLTSAMQAMTAAGKQISESAQSSKLLCSSKDSVISCHMGKVQNTSSLASVSARPVKRSRITPSVANRKDISAQKSKLSQPPSLAGKIIASAKQNAPEMAVGTAANIGMRAATHVAITKFGLAAAATTVPGGILTGIILGIAGATLVGAVRGGFRRVRTIKREAIPASGDIIQPREKYWQISEFIRGMGDGAKGALNWKTMLWTGMLGGIVGGVGAGMLQHYGHAAVSSNGHQPLPSNGAVPTHVEQQSHLVSRPAVPQPPATSVASGNGLAGSLSQKQFDMLPDDVKKLAASHNTRALLARCKEESFKLLNGRHRDLQQAARLLKYGHDVAAQTGTHTLTTAHIDRDLTYMVRNFGGSVLRAMRAG